MSAWAGFVAYNLSIALLQTVELREAIEQLTRPGSFRR